MSATFQLVVSSVGETYFDGQAISATFPGSAGEMTVLAHHEPLITTLKEGTVIVRTAEGVKEIPVRNGILECADNRAVVLL